MLLNSQGDDLMGTYFAAAAPSKHSAHGHAQLPSAAAATRFAPPAQRHVDPFGVLGLTNLWPANSTSRVRPRPWPVGPAYNSSEFDVFINTSYVVLNGIHYLSPEFNDSGYPPGPATVFHSGFTILSRLFYPQQLLWSLVSEYQVNELPPLGHPDCQFPDISLPGMCGNIITYIPPSPDNATLDEVLEGMSRYNMLPKTNHAWNEAGAPPIMPPEHVKREVIKGALGPVGHFRGPLSTRTNASTLHLFGPGLRSFEAWQVEAAKGALWDAYAEVAVYMEILQVQGSEPSPGRLNGEAAICRPEEALCAPCGAAVAGPSVALTFSYDFFDVVVLGSEFERHRPVLTESFFEGLHSRGVDVRAVRVEPAAALPSTDAAPHQDTSGRTAAGLAALVLLVLCGASSIWRSLHSWRGSSPKAPSSKDAALQGLLRHGDISICVRGDGLPWLLGTGAHGKVYRAVRKGVQDAAVKVLTNVDAGQLKVFSNEIQLLKRISYDRNIVQFYGACLETQPPMLMMEYMGGGDLFSALQSNARGSGAAHLLSWWRRGRNVALDIARGLHFLHSEHVVHNDLKTKNILLSANYDIAKIADVGLGRIMDASHMSTGLEPCGTFVYAAPEMLMGARCDEKVDIYSFGVVLWEMVCRERPLRGHLRARRVPEECPAAVNALIDACIEAETPALRPSAHEIFVRLANSSATPEEEAAAASSELDAWAANSSGEGLWNARSVDSPHPPDDALHNGHVGAAVARLAEVGVLARARSEADLTPATAAQAAALQHKRGDSRGSGALGTTTSSLHGASTPDAAEEAARLSRSSEASLHTLGSICDAASQALAGETRPSVGPWVPPLYNAGSHRSRRLSSGGSGDGGSRRFVAAQRQR
ncbi:hypothetical protein WJX81_004930 [Elliptochloris bilobata]|uniref:Protein kinase domain-containing protein n=1 Tax=Elliptochloris bilobata TaxID=381761 RepID=A0AAW1RL29_9CHLO